MVRGGVSEIKRKFFILLLPFFIALDIFSSLSLLWHRQMLQFGFSRHQSWFSRVFCSFLFLSLSFFVSLCDKRQERKFILWFEEGWELKRKQWGQVKIIHFIKKKQRWTLYAKIWSFNEFNTLKVNYSVQIFSFCNVYTRLRTQSLLNSQYNSLYPKYTCAMLIFVKLMLEKIKYCVWVSQVCTHNVFLTCKNLRVT